MIKEEAEQRQEEGGAEKTGTPGDNKKKSRKKKGLFSRLLDLLVFLVFLGGIGVMLYPRISDWVNARSMSIVVQGYSNAVKDLAPEDYTKVFEQARDYNRRLKENPDPFLEPGKTEGYDDTLKVDDTGVMGYVTIEKIRVRLPFYHGTDEYVLQNAIGHVEGSSVPIGEAGDHAVLSAHRGLPTAKLFTDLPELAVGDIFEVTVLDRTFTYEVDQILTVLPDEMEELEPVERKDLVTLVTCTHYGINTHRLLVRGHRTSDRASGRNSGAGNKAGAGDPGQKEEAGQSLDRYVPYAVGAAVVIFLILMVAPVKKK